MLVLGLDVSITKPGYAIWDSETDDIVLYGHIPTPASWTLGERLEHIVEAVKDLVSGDNPYEYPEICVDEIYVEQPISFRSGTGTIRIAQVHGALRYMLYYCFALNVDDEKNVSSVKKFATGKGNATKHEMIAAAEARWDGDFTDDEADAAWVAVCGYTEAHAS